MSEGRKATTSSRSPNPSPSPNPNLALQESYPRRVLTLTLTLTLTRCRVALLSLHGGAQLRARRSGNADEHAVAHVMVPMAARTMAVLDATELAAHSLLPEERCFSLCFSRRVE